MDQMEDEPQLLPRDTLFTTEDASDVTIIMIIIIIIIINERALPTAMDLPPPLVALESGLDYDKCEMVCGGVAWTRVYQERNTTQLSSVHNNLGVLGAHAHTTHHYTPQLLQFTPQTATHNIQVASDSNSHFTCECYIDEGVECMPNSGGPVEEVRSTSDTQQFVSGLIIFQDNC